MKYILALCVLVGASIGYMVPTRSEWKPITVEASRETGGVTDFAKTAAVCDQGTLAQAVTHAEQQAKDAHVRLGVQSLNAVASKAYLKKVMGDSYEEWADEATSAVALHVVGQPGGFVFMAAHGCYLGFARLGADHFDGLIVASDRGGA